MSDDPLAAATDEQQTTLAYLRALGLVSDAPGATPLPRRSHRKHGAGRRVLVYAVEGKMQERPIAGAPPPGEKQRRRKAAKEARRKRRQSRG